MKTLLYVLLLGLMTNSAVAATKIISGQVLHIRTFEGDVHPEWRPPRFWFSLKEHKDVGSCNKLYDRPIFVGNDTASYSMLLGAFMAGKEVTVYINEDAKYHTWCKAAHITLGDPEALN